MKQPGDRSSQAASDGTGPGSRPRRLVAGAATEVVAVPILSLRPADSPRLNGENKVHIARLAEVETRLPPILVDRRTMRVIDGMHRLMAASVQGRETIDVIFFDGSEADAFLRAVQENVTHGLPLSQADRHAGAERIIASHPHMSDRAIGKAAGLAAKTVAAIRKRANDAAALSNTRIGRDGKVRPLDSGEGRRRAAELLENNPKASLRDVAWAAGISPATVLDVRNRLKRGKSPVPEKPNASRSNVTSSGVTDGPADNESGIHADDGGASAQTSRRGPQSATCSVAAPDLTATVEKLLRDPSLRNNERGKGILRLLHINALGAEQLADATPIIPPHNVWAVLQLAHEYAKMWQNFARELDGRARIIDPSAKPAEPPAPLKFSRAPSRT